MTFLKRLLMMGGRAPLIGMTVLAVLVLVVAVLGFGFSPAPGNTLTIAAGPEGSNFARTAARYQKILEKQGVQLNILTTGGSRDNLRRLMDATQNVDVAFVLGGQAGEAEVEKLVSLGSVSYQPLMVFYRGSPKKLLSEFKGLRLDIGEEGSGTRTLALALLAANGIKPGSEGDKTVLVDTPDQDIAKALESGKVDAFFAMNESTPSALIRNLLRGGKAHLFDFAQSEAYSRRFSYLNKLTLPRGAINLGEDIPAADVRLIGPTVQLVAREGLHPAISDLLLETARAVHARPGLYARPGEFPSPLEREFRISEDAQRYYSSGRNFLYRTFPFWVASLIARVAAILVPVLIVLIPGMRVLPALYRWSMTRRIYRYYGELQKLEKEWPDADAARRVELLQRLDRIDASVFNTRVPSAFGDLFYDLRGHITDVRRQLRQAPTA
ncbi:C4-dicarboxylate ABC transporter substrate-binding protein [Hylemonella gracilis]|uniref:C4-dicarboxylate ABC transporter substrate-binding protein n=1 Tax=Hylemonella gracilis TaxID=80880 RepID=A0A4V1A230_9BURK|nr:TAXI family TRAP transporter solute-binding subunit [Hylemonella gracilis]QBK04619.1 C4-dicarboxylate ABC transporter substrate-binding protein [Hylemonella gracilis]